MGLGVAEIDEKTIPKQLSNMSFIALNDFRADFLVSTHYVPILFGIELGGEAGGINQVAEHHRELAAFSFWSRRLGGSRCNLRRLVWLDCCLLSQGSGSRCR